MRRRGQHARPEACCEPLSSWLAKGVAGGMYVARLVRGMHAS